MRAVNLINHPSGNRKHRSLSLSLSPFIIRRFTTCRVTLFSNNRPPFFSFFSRVLNDGGRESARPVKRTLVWRSMNPTCLTRSCPLPATERRNPYRTPILIPRLSINRLRNRLKEGDGWLNRRILARRSDGYGSLREEEAT